MTIVLNEREWAEEAITSRSLGKKPFETLYRVARYYIDSGMKKAEVRRLLENFLLQCEPTSSLTKWSDTLEAAVNRAMKYEAVNIDAIRITSNEMKTIEAIEGRQAQRLAFTLLCLAKYWIEVSGKRDGWVNNKDSEIMSLADINTSLRRQSLMYHSLCEAGLIQFSRKVDSTSVKVCFIQDGDTVMEITDFRDLGYQYLMYHGGPFFVCSNCGRVTKRTTPANSRPPKYCKECAAQIKQMQVNACKQRARMAAKRIKESAGSVA